MIIENMAADDMTVLYEEFDDFILDNDIEDEDEAEDEILCGDDDADDIMDTIEYFDDLKSFENDV